MLEIFVFVEQNVAKVDCELADGGLKSPRKDIIFDNAL